jgi:hypothetical protein
METIITNDLDMATIVAMTLKGEKYLEEHNGQIDLDDDGAVEAMMVKNVFSASQKR